MKKNFLTLLLVFAISDCSFAQDAKDSGFKLAFNEYKVASCLYDILEAIVESDTAQLRYPSNIYFYSISYGNFINYRDVTIRPTRWYKDLPCDTKGIIVVQGAKFVLMGGIGNDALFKKMKNKIELTILYPVLQVFDDLDNDTKWLGWDKSPTALVGSIKSCGVPRIDLHIDVDKKIKSLNLAAKHP
jgi:hypothetical protein